MWRIALGVTGAVLGALLGFVIGLPVTDMLNPGPHPEFGPMHRLLALFIGAPIGGLAGCVLGVISGAPFDRPRRQKGAGVDSG
jgi:hypothetical protein